MQQLLRVKPGNLKVRENSIADDNRADKDIHIFIFRNAW